MDLDLVVQGGTLVTSTETFRADVGIRGEQIASLGQDLRGRQVIDARDRLVMPGAIDPHVHLKMRVGDTVSSDDWRTGTLAASCGGTTTVLDFVEPRPGQSLRSALDERLAEAEGQAVIDIGLHMTLSRADSRTLAEVPEMVAAGVSSFKTYTTYDGLRLDDDGLRAAMVAVGEAGGLMMTHCEDDATLKQATRALLDAGRVEAGMHARSRPAIAETSAVKRVLALADASQTPVYIVHISTAGAAQAVVDARNRGQVAFGETCAQYLLLSEACYDLPGFEPAKFVCAPPLRAPADQSALWRSLAKGELQTIGSDHCPFNFVGQKDRGGDRFDRIPGGLPGIEARLALLYTYGVVAGRIGLNQWVEACCAAPARLFGLYPRKGSITPGADADLVVFDPGRKVALTRPRLHESVDYTPYEGMPVQGYPVMTIARGGVIVQEGEFIGAAGRGRFLRCAPPQFAAEVGGG